MGVVFADNVADDSGTFLEARCRIQTQKTHRMHQPAMDGLQPVADIG